MIERPTLWKMLERADCSTGKDYLKILDEKGYRVSDWIIDIVSKLDFSSGDIQWPLPLVRVRVASLGFTSPLHLSELYQAAEKQGYEKLPIEAALSLRMHYDEQPTGEWLRMGTPMDVMIDSDGVPHLPKLGKALGKYYIETYWSYPQAVFHPHNEFVFIDRTLK